MADIEVLPLLDRLAADSRRSVPVTASAIRRRGDRRRTVARTAAAGGVIVAVGATAGTAVAVSGSTNSSRTPNVFAGHPTPSSSAAAMRQQLASLRAQLAAVTARLVEDQTAYRDLGARPAKRADRARWENRNHDLAAEIQHDNMAIAALSSQIRYLKDLGCSTCHGLDGYRGLATPTPTPTNASGVASSAAPRGPEPTATPTPSRPAS